MPLSLRGSAEDRALAKVAHLAARAELSYVPLVSDLAAGERITAGGRAGGPQSGQGVPVLKERGTIWRGWCGGLAMVIVCLAPEALLVLGRPGGLRVHVGTNFAFEGGTMLATIPSIAAFTLLAPIVGYRRRDALLMTFPIPNLYLAWIAGARAVQLRPGDTLHRWTGSREATTAAALMQCLAFAAYAAWVVVIEVIYLH